MEIQDNIEFAATIVAVVLIIVTWLIRALKRDSDGKRRITLEEILELLPQLRLSLDELIASSMVQKWIDENGYTEEEARQIIQIVFDAMEKIFEEGVRLEED